MGLRRTRTQSRRGSGGRRIRRGDRRRHPQGSRIRCRTPPEDWLFKARTGKTVVDVLHRVNGVPVEAATLDSAEQREVLAIRMPVLPPTTVAIQKLRALNEHHCDFAKLLPAVRAIRERLDWDRIKSQTADNDYTVAFLVLADRLGLTI
jgi:hypothetical protein